MKVKFLSLSSRFSAFMFRLLSRLLGIFCMYGLESKSKLKLIIIFPNTRHC